MTTAVSTEDKATAAKQTEITAKQTSQSETKNTVGQEKKETSASQSSKGNASVDPSKVQFFGVSVPVGAKLTISPEPGVELKKREVRANQTDSQKVNPKDADAYEQEKFPVGEYEITIETKFGKTSKKVNTASVYNGLSWTEDFPPIELKDEYVKEAEKLSLEAVNRIAELYYSNQEALIPTVFPQDMQESMKKQLLSGDPAVGNSFVSREEWSRQVFINPRLNSKSSVEKKFHVVSNDSFIVNMEFDREYNSANKVIKDQVMTDKNCRAPFEFRLKDDGKIELIYLWNPGIFSMTGF